MPTLLFLFATKVLKPSAAAAAPTSEPTAGSGRRKKPEPPPWWMLLVDPPTTPKPPKPPEPLPIARRPVVEVLPRLRARYSQYAENAHFLSEAAHLDKRLGELERQVEQLKEDQGSRKEQARRRRAVRKRLVELNAGLQEFAWNELRKRHELAIERIRRQRRLFAADEAEFFEILQIARLL